MHFFLNQLTLFVTVSIEDCESWDMLCLRTPLGARAKGVDGERDGSGDFKMCKGMRLLRWDSPVSSIMWLRVRLSEDMNPSMRRETRKLSFHLQLTLLPETCDE